MTTGGKTIMKIQLIGLIILVLGIIITVAIKGSSNYLSIIATAMIIIGALLIFSKQIMKQLGI